MECEDVKNKDKKKLRSVIIPQDSWIKDDTKTIKNLVEDTTAKVGEKIEIKRFARYEI